VRDADADAYCVYANTHVHSGSVVLAADGEVDAATDAAYVSVPTPISLPAPVATTTGATTRTSPVRVWLS
jgi:hypothetical protein